MARTESHRRGTLSTDSFRRAAAVLLLLLASNTSFGEPSTQAASKTLEAIARLPGLAAADITPILAQVGYRPDINQADWNRLSSREQLEIAFRSADAAGGGNGERFTASVARLVERKYESIAFDPMFSHVFDGPAPEQKIAFAKPSAAQRMAPLPPDIAMKLDVLSVYVEGTGGLSRVSVLRSHFGLRSPKLEQALRKRDTGSMLKEAAALAVPPPTLEERVEHLRSEVVRRYDSAELKLEPRLREAIKDLKASKPLDKDPIIPVALNLDKDGNISPDWRPPNEPAPPGAPPRPGPMPPPSRSPEASRTAKAAQANAQFDQRYYRTPQSRSFRSVVMRGGGRGGVVAGNDVTANAALGKPRSISIVANGGACASHTTPVEIVLENGSGKRFTLSKVPCDAAVAAKRAVFDSFGELGAWSPGNAIGLATISMDVENPVFPFFIPADLDPAMVAQRKGMVLHPALIDLDIGRSIALLDMWPAARVAILRETEGSREVIAWLKSIETARASTWKWFDAPQRITINGSALAVGPVNARNRAVLAIRVFDGLDLTKEEILEEPTGALQLAKNAARCKTQVLNKPLSSLDDIKVVSMCKQLVTMQERTQVGKELETFDNAFATLERNMPDFRRAEEFLRVLAVFRWVRANDGAYAGNTPLIAASRRTPDSVLVGLNAAWISAAGEPRDYATECRTFFSRLASLEARAKAMKPSYELASAKLALAELDDIRELRDCNPRDR